MKCNAEECQYHNLTEAVVKDMRIAVDRLMEGQGQMRETIIQLTEAFKQMDRLERRLDKVEEETKEENKDQEKSIRDLEKNFYKAAGGASVVFVIAQVALKVFFGI